MLWEQRLVLVVAPAGSGKTTLAAQIAAAADTPVAWCSAERSYGEEAAFLERLERAFALAVPELPSGWTTIKEAAAALEELEHLGRPALLVVDDFHVLQNTPAEDTLERLVEYAPAELAVLVASRTRPRFNLSRLRVSGALLELGPDDLRFRSWEVERLFDEHYGDPLPPEELALLAQRTEGWAAGLQLFHLATRGKPPGERRATLAALRSRWRAAREYLADNVLHDLPPVLREFLIRTSVLTVLSGALCDALLERKGSDELLEELERRQIFTTVLDDEGRYRYHEVLRAQLEAISWTASATRRRRRTSARPASCSRPTARCPTPCARTPARRTPTPWPACWARAARSSSTGGSPGSTCSPPRSSTTTRGSSSPAPATSARPVDSTARSRRTARRSAASAAPPPPSSAGASAWPSPPGSSPRSCPPPTRGSGCSARRRSATRSPRGASRPASRGPERASPAASPRC